MKPLSLKWRVSLWVSTVLVAVITTISIVAYVEFDEAHLRSLDRTLLAMVNGIAASLDNHGVAEEMAMEVRVVTGGPGRNPSTFYRIWMDGASTDVLASDTPDSEVERWLRELPDIDKPSLNELSFVNKVVPHNEYRAVWMRRKIRSRPVPGAAGDAMPAPDEDVANIVVAGPSHFTYHEMYEFERLLLVLGASLVLGSVVAVMWTVRCGLRPIHVTAERLRHVWRPNAGKALFDDLKVPEELEPFVEALKEMFVRLDKVLEQQKQFTSDAAHELRTPLALAKSTLQVAQMSERDVGEYRRAIADALKDVARMEHLTEQLLVLARMDETDGRQRTDDVGLARFDGAVLSKGACPSQEKKGQSAFSTTESRQSRGPLSDIRRGDEPVQLDVLLSELAESFNARMERSGGKVVLEDAPPTTVQGHLDELIRLFANVLDNATKYGPSDGTVRIGIEIANGQQPGAMENQKSKIKNHESVVTVRIRDEGGNIPAEALPYLYDRFYRVDQSRSSSTGGAGLGLAIARQIVRRHNGDIAITSDHTYGTLVSIRLPLAN
jgi:signal transduction histidine kinase